VGRPPIPRGNEMVMDDVRTMESTIPRSMYDYVATLLGRMSFGLRIAVAAQSHYDSS
jgi:hypothetical protein